MSLVLIAGLYWLYNRKALKELDPHIVAIFQKYLDGKHTTQELVVLLSHFGLPGESENLKALIEQQFEKAKPSPIDEAELNDMVAEMHENIHNVINPPKRGKYFIFWYAAASIILLCSIATITYYTLQDNKQVEVLTSDYGGDVLPGKNRATVTLSDGSTFELNENKAGIAIQNDSIIYDDGSVIASTVDAVTATINVPRAGNYRITLPDGTKVVLNSESSLQYPTRFRGKVRKVNLVGEAYFEVAANPDQAFVVSTGKQELKVLGTHFNIQAYPNESIGTTLVEGSVELSTNDKKVKLEPGQYAQFNDKDFKITEVSVEDYTAWTRNLFTFNLVPLSDIFRQMERWYDVKIDYPAALGKEKYFMEIPKDHKLSEVLTSLASLSNIKFTIEGRRVLVRQ